MGGEDAVFGTTGGTDTTNLNTQGGRPVEPGTRGTPPYSPYEYVNEMYNIQGAIAMAPVLMAKGQTNYGPATQPAAQQIGEFTLGGPNKYVGGIARVGGTKDDVRSLRDALNWGQRLDPGQMSNFTNSLYAAGFYPSSSYTKGGKPPNGRVFDEMAQYGATKLYQAVVEYNAANPNAPKSMQEILQERIDLKQGQSLIDQNVSGQQGSVYRVTTDDPATLRATVTKTAQAILGRAVSSQEQDALVEKMLAAQRAPQEAAIEAGQTADTGSDVRLATAQVDAQAQLEEQMKAAHPDQAGAYQELNYYNMLTKMLGGGGSQ